MKPDLDILSLSSTCSITDLRTNSRWSATDIENEVAKRLRSLQQHGLKKGDIVVITHGGTPAFFADLFAAWYSGACAVCLNPSLTRPELLNVCDFVRPAIVLMNSGQYAQAQDFPFPLSCMESDATEAGPTSINAELPDTDPALILFTSGTTGDPKGVVHTFHSLRQRLTCNLQHLPLQTLQRTLCILPTHFGHGLIGNCLTPLVAGGDLLLFQNPGVAGAAKMAEVMKDNEITFMSSVASFWKLVLKTSPGLSSASLEQISVGSAPLSKELWSKIIDWSGCKNVVNMYGITETANWVAGASAIDFNPEDGLVGTMWGGTAAVLKENNTRAATGTGEIMLQAPSLMQGYFQRPDLTAEVIKDGWYRTGDRGHIDDAGKITLLGRTKTEINKAGIKILPEEIDLLLEGHECINEACAFAVPDLVSGETVAIAVSLFPGKEMTVAEMREWCRKRIRADAIPEKWFIVPEIPKTDRGKVNRQQVKEYCLANE